MPEMSQYSIFKTVFFYCALILFSPIATFFGVKYFFFEGLIGSNSNSLTTNVWSAIIAVVVLHIAVGLFIRKAYSVAEQGKIVEKID